MTQFWWIMPTVQCLLRLRPNDPALVGLLANIFGFRDIHWNTDFCNHDLGIIELRRTAPGIIHSTSIHCILLYNNQMIKKDTSRGHTLLPNYLYFSQSEDRTWRFNHVVNNFQQRMTGFEPLAVFPPFVSVMLRHSPTDRGVSKTS